MPCVAVGICAGFSVRTVDTPLETGESSSPSARTEPVWNANNAVRVILVPVMRKLFINCFISTLLLKDPADRY
jgi:hypothetical protein